MKSGSAPRHFISLRNSDPGERFSLPIFRDGDRLASEGISAFPGPGSVNYIVALVARLADPVFRTRRQIPTWYQKLQSHESGQPIIPSLIDDTHAALAQFFLYTSNCQRTQNGNSGIPGTLGGGAMANAKPSLKRLHQRLRLTLGLYTDLTEATCEMMMTFKSIPWTAKNRAMVLVQRQHEITAQAAYLKARHALMVALALPAWSAQEHQLTNWSWTTFAPHFGHHAPTIGWMRAPHKQRTSSALPNG
jgi:hypothetical protein